MHILYLHQYFVPPDGSGGTRSYEMARRFVKSGHKVTLITSSAFFPDTYHFTSGITHLTIEGISLRVLHVPYSNRLSFFRRILAFLKFALISILETVKLREIDVVFATSTPLTIALPGIIGHWWHRCPMVFEVRDLWPEIPIAMGALKNGFLVKCARWLELFAYRNSSRIVALSPGMKEGIVASGVPEAKVVTIPNSSDVDLFRGLSVSAQRFKQKYPEIPDGLWVVYAGTIGKVNGIDYFVEIAAAMKRRNPTVHFVIVGDGMFKPQVLSLAKKLDVLNVNFWIVDPVAKNLLPDVLAAATAASSFVIDIPELWHNSANKFFDAFAANKPMIINHEGWQADFLRETGAGIVIPPRDAIKAAEMITEFLSDERRFGSASQAAASAADNDFNRATLADKLTKVLEEVVDEN